MKRHESLVLAVVLGLSIGLASTLAQSPTTADEGFFAMAARAYGLPPPGSVALPAGHRELWIRPSQGMVCCYPMPLLHVTDGPAGARGELLLVRMHYNIKGGPVLPHPPGERCVQAPVAKPDELQEYCVQPWALASGDWAGVNRALDELGAWSKTSLCPPSPKDVPIFDAARVYVQRLAESGMTTYDCQADDPRAAPLFKYFVSLFGSTGIPTN